MTGDRSKFESARDGDYWSILAEFIDRRDRGEPVDPADFAGGDPVLTKRIQDCLAGFGWLEHALSGTSADEKPNAETPMPESIGDYNVIRELGRGGMGVVYEAVHQSLGRRVALKVLFDPSLRGRTARERFLREARTAASLHHTNIVPVFDVGTADGHLYFAMQLIEGGSLERLAGDTSNAPSHARSCSATDRSAAREARATSLDPLQVARLGLQAAEALAYAHAHGVIHRDIKPSNLLLDSSGTLWVADFGLSRRPTDTAVTATGARIGTPRYMSPEQATAQWDATDARTDIYSLGVTLYELLTGRPVFSPSTPPQLLFQIIRSEPQPPRRINSRVPRDLETIVLKAMAKRPADRYGSAQDLAEDLRRLLADEPVHARRIGLFGRCLRWCRREPLVAAVSALSLMTLAGVVAAYQIRLTRQRDAAIEATADAKGRLADALFERARAVRATSDTGRRWLALELLRQSTSILPRSELSVEASRAIQLFDVLHTRTLQEIGGPATAVAIEPVDGRVAVGIDGRAGTAVAIWDPKSQSVTHRLATAAPVNSLVYSPDGRSLAGTTERHTCLWNLESGLLQVLPGGRAGLSTVAFSSDGRRLFGFADGLRVWDVLTGQQQATLLDGAIQIGHVVTSGDGRILAAAMTTEHESPAQIYRWSLPDLRPLDPLRVHEVRPDPLAEAMGVLSLAASPRGNRVAASCGDSRIRVWDLETGKPLAVLEGHRAPAVSMAFSSGGDTLISCDGFELKLWDARSGAELATLIRSKSEMGPLSALAMSRDGVIVTAGDECRLWQLATPTFLHILHRQPESVRSLAASPDGRWLAWAAQDRVRIWDRSDEEVRRDIAITLRGELSLVFTPDSRTIAVVGTGTNRLQIVEAATGNTVGDWVAEPASAVAAAAAGDEIAVAHMDGVIRRWNPMTGQIMAAYVGHTGPVTSLTYSPDGGLVAAANHDTSDSRDRTIHLWETSSGRLVRSWSGHRTVAFGVAFSPDGERLASCGGDGMVRLWNVATGELMAALAGHSQSPTGVAFSVDGSLLASCGLDGHVFLWSARTGTLLADFTSRASGSLAAVTFSRDGRWILASGGPFRWTHAAPGAVEAWDIKEIQQELGQLGITWESVTVQR